MLTLRYSSFIFIHQYTRESTITRDFVYGTCIYQRDGDGQQMMKAVAQYLESWAFSLELLGLSTFDVGYLGNKEKG